MKFVDGNGRPVKAKIHEITFSFAYRGQCLILTFETGQPKRPVSPIWSNGEAELTSDTSFLCMTEGEARAAQVAIVRILELATDHGVKAVGPFDGSIPQRYRFVKPTARKES